MALRKTDHKDTIFRKINYNIIIIEIYFFNFFIKTLNSIKNICSHCPSLIKNKNRTMMYPLSWEILQWVHFFGTFCIQKFKIICQLVWFL